MISSSTISADARTDLLRRAALGGPGYQGQRRPLSDGQRMTLAEEFRRTGIEPPAYLVQPTEWVDRRAKLFEAGDYPDKGLSISIEQIQSLAAQFDLPIPVLIEHGDSPLHLGFVTGISAEGSALFGAISLTKEADALLAASGASSLSIGLEGDLSRLREVSVVRHPRVPSAQIFHLLPVFTSTFADVDYQQQKREREAKSRRAEATRIVEKFVVSGQLKPAQAHLMTAVFSSDASVEFEDSHVPLSQLLTRFCESLPVSTMFHSSRSTPVPDHALMLPEEAEFYRKHFPGVDLGVIAKTR